jgi:hypothetical protein
LVAIAYFTFAGADEGRARAYHYYRTFGDEVATMIAAGVRTDARAVKDGVRAFADLGADELILHPESDDLDEVSRLAETVL